MKILISLFLLTAFASPTHAADGIICKGVECNTVQVEQTRGSGLLNLRDDQVKKLDGPDSQNAQNKNYLFKEEVAQEQGMDLKFSEVSVGTCLIDPTTAKTFYKILEKDESSTKIRYVAENEPHSYMLRGNFVFWKLPDTSNAFKKLRKFPCDRTPNLWDDSYVAKCTKGVNVGDLYCDPKKKF